MISPDRRARPPRPDFGPPTRPWAFEELGLVPIKLSPIDVPLVVILEQDLPFFKRFAVAVAFAGAALDDLDPLLAFAVGGMPPRRRGSSEQMTLR